MSSTTEQPRIDHDDERPEGAAAPVADAPVPATTEAPKSEPFVYANTTRRQERKEPMSLKKRLLIGGSIGTAAVTLVTGLVLGSSNSNSSKPTDPPKPTETSQAGPTSNPNNGETSGDVLVQTTSIETMKAMKDMKTYANLSYADHLAYAYDNNPEMAISTPDQDLGFTDPSSIPPYFWDSVNGTALSQGDTTEGAKIAAANDYYTADSSGNIAPGYQAVIDSIEQTGGQGVRNSTTLVFVDSGKPQTGVDRAGHKITYINVTFYDADSSTGKRESDNKTAQAIRQEVKLLNGKTVVFYPIGLTGPGQAAPDGGTY